MKTHLVSLFVIIAICLAVIIFLIYRHHLKTSSRYQQQQQQLILARAHLCYPAEQLTELTRIVQGTKFSGNDTLARIGDLQFRQWGNQAARVVGADGILQLYNQSNFVSDELVDAAARYWNLLAGTVIVQRVMSATDCDEVIRDGKQLGHALGSHAADDRGLIFYPENWHTDNLSVLDQQNWRMAVLLHEIGHALGIPHLGGGPTGDAAQRAGVMVDDFMATWTPRIAVTADRPVGVNSTVVDAAALALIELNRSQPRQLATWLFDNPTGYVNFNAGKVTSYL